MQKVFPLEDVSLMYKLNLSYKETINLKLLLVFECSKSFGKSFIITYTLSS